MIGKLSAKLLTKPLQFKRDRSWHQNLFAVHRAVSKKKCPYAKEGDSYKFIDWLLSKKGREKIIEYKVDGKKLFYVDK